jgi:hypothetical protein
LLLFEIEELLFQSLRARSKTRQPLYLLLSRVQGVGKGFDLGVRGSDGFVELFQLV